MITKGIKTTFTVRKSRKYIAEYFTGIENT